MVSATFGNRAYVWSDVPERLQGMRFTRLDGGVKTPLEVVASKPTTILIA